MMTKNPPELRMILLILKRLVAPSCACPCSPPSPWPGKPFWFSSWKKLLGIWKCSWDNRLGLFSSCPGVNCWGSVSTSTTTEDSWVGSGWCSLELRRLRMTRWWVLGPMMWGTNPDTACPTLGMWSCRLEVILRCQGPWGTSVTGLVWSAILSLIDTFQMFQRQSGRKHTYIAIVKYEI